MSIVIQPPMRRTLQAGNLFVNLPFPYIVFRNYGCALTVGFCNENPNPCSIIYLPTLPHISPTNFGVCLGGFYSKNILELISVFWQTSFVLTNPDWHGVQNASMLFNSYEDWTNIPLNNITKVKWPNTPRTFSYHEFQNQYPGYT